MFDKRLTEIKNRFGISSLADWGDVEVSWLRSMHGVGDVTIQHIRIYLAMQGQTLKNDCDPQYWKDRLGHIRIGQDMHDDDSSIICPFTILIDSAETQPFTFTGIHADADEMKTDQFGDKTKRTYVVPTEFRSLGRYPESLGDYSVDGYVGRVAIERKSMEDLQSTILGWTRKGEEVGRRERFKHELATLSTLESACVVVECSFIDVLQNAPQWGKKTSRENAKILACSILAFQQDYSVQWEFAGNRRLAEWYAFRWFKRFIEKREEETKRTESLVAAL